MSWEHPAANRRTTYTTCKDVRKVLNVMQIPLTHKKPTLILAKNRQARKFNWYADHISSTGAEYLYKHSENSHNTQEKKKVSSLQSGQVKFWYLNIGIYSLIWCKLMAVTPFFPFLRGTSIFQKPSVDKELGLHTQPILFATNITIS